VDLPTYTNIWRIEKRLYKLYDFRLPMPLPVGQIAVFTAIAVPYVIVLTVLGLPFSHTSFWLYVLPPGVLAWLATRPVLESKRLPELIVSQLRYLGEPRSWCRLAPLAEKDEILVVARVWRRGDEEPAGLAVRRRIRLAGRRELVSPPQAAAAPAGLAAVDPQPQPAERVPVAPVVPAWAVVAARRAGTQPVRALAVAPARERAAWPASRREGTQAHVAPPAQQRGPSAARHAVTPPATLPPATVPATVPPATVPPATVPSATVPPVTVPPATVPPATVPSATVPPVTVPPATVPPPRARLAPSVASPPAVTVTGDRPDGRPLRVVERALREPADKRGDGWHDRVVVVPGGHRPGRPDFQQRDRSRAQLPVAGSRRIVVLGCTVGAGQTMTALMTGEVLAVVRDEPVAVLDLNPGHGSLAERADSRPAVAAGQPPPGPEHLHHSPAPSRLAVISSDVTEGGGPPEQASRDVARIFELLSARYSLTLADPAASAVPRVLAIADQLVLVAPASQDAARAIAMTLEWLEAHGYAGLAGNCAAVINGVSRQTMAHVEQAEAVARGRCRAIVRVPWDDQLRIPGPERAPGADPLALAGRPGVLLGAAAVQAYTALAGVLVAGLATAPELRRARS